MAEELLQTAIKRLTTQVKRQERKTRLKQACTERARSTGDAKRIDKARAEEEQAVAQLQRLEVDRAQVEQELAALRYVAHQQPVARATVAKALQVSPERIDELVARLQLVTDGEGLIYTDRERMTEITVSRDFAAWDARRKTVITRWGALTDAYPAATRDELKERYLLEYRDAEGIDRYLQERENTSEPLGYHHEPDAGKWIILGSVLLLVCLILLVILAVRNPGAIETVWTQLRFTLLNT